VPNPAARRRKQIANEVDNAMRTRRVVLALLIALAFAVPAAAQSDDARVSLNAAISVAETSTSPIRVSHCRRRRGFWESSFWECWGNRCVSADPVGTLLGHSRSSRQSGLCSALAAWTV